MTIMPLYNIDPSLLELNTDFFGQKKVNFMLIGKMGSGKTTMSITGPRPVYYYGLDKGGSIGISKRVNEGWLVVDSRFENDDPANPRAWKGFQDDFNAKCARKTFNAFGSLVIDSTTGTSDICMHQILSERGRAGLVPSGEGFNKSDYSEQKNMLYKALSLPCSVIVTAHVDVFKDEATNRIFSSPFLTGSLKQQIPALFNEIYYMSAMATSKGLLVEAITQPDGVFDARSSLGFGGTLATREKQDVMKIIRKAGLKIPEAIPVGYYDTIPTEVSKL